MDSIREDVLDFYAKLVSGFISQNILRIMLLGKAVFVLDLCMATNFSIYPSLFHLAYIWICLGVEKFKHFQNELVLLFNS